jgi:hypothetical protein
MSKKYNVCEHIRARHLHVESVLVCPHCAVRCSSKSSLRSHMWRRHRDQNLMEAN